MTHQDEYHDNLIRMLELVWGEGYMAPGGVGNLEKLFDGIGTAGRRALDIGSGIGGPAIDMAREFGLEVVGIDLEAPLVERANRSAAAKGLADRCTFRTVEAGPLDFPDQSFDIVTSSGAITQIEDKVGIFSECYRVLQPGGWLTCYDWLKSDAPYSDDMYYWFKMEGLTYALGTLEEYEKHLEQCGFVDISIVDASDWYRVEVRREYEKIRNELYPRMVELLGREDADYFVENWRAMVVVCESGEMRQGYCRARRP